MQDTLNNLEIELEKDISLAEKITLTGKLTDGYLQANDFNQALEYGEKLLVYAKDSIDPEKIAQAHQKLSIIHTAQGNLRSSLSHSLSALEYFQSRNENETVVACSHIGVAYSRLGEYQDALKYLYSAVDLAEAQNNYSGMGRVLSFIGVTYSKIGDYPKALETMKQAIKTICKGENREVLPVAFNNLGNLYKINNEYGLALGYFKRALEMWQNSSNLLNTAIVYHNIADIYRDKGFYEKAEEYYKASQKINIELDNKSLLISNYGDLAELYDIQGFVQKAEENYVLSLALAEEIHELEQMEELYARLARFYAKIGKFETALEYKDKIINLKQDVFSQNLSKQIAELQAKYDFDQKAREAELYRQKNEELAYSYSCIEKQKQELEELTKSQDFILGLVSHDLKNTVGGITTLLDLIQYETNEAPTHSFLDQINYLAEKALQLVNDILFDYQLSMHKYVLEKEQMPLNLLMQSYESSFNSMVTQKNIKIDYTYPEKDLIVEVNNNKFWQIMHNLVNNSFKFTREKGQISIVLKESNNAGQLYAEILVKDNGIGIKSENLPFVFEKFTKIGREGTAGETSTGLGLSIVKKLVELHDGTIEAISEYAKGTTFKILLPLVTN